MTRKEQLVLTTVWRNGGCSASYDSFVVGSSSVLVDNFVLRNPPIRKAEKRCVQVLGDSANLTR